MKVFKYTLTLSILLFSFYESYSNGEIPAFYKIGSSNASIENTKNHVVEVLKSNGFEVLGEYAPAGNPNLYVVAFTNEDLKNITSSVEDRGVLASIFKIGFLQKDGTVDITLVNPEYIFYAYLRENMDPVKEELDEITKKVKSSLSSIGNEWLEFGGSMTPKELKKYHYMLGMPYFDDPVKLNEFSSFDEGVKTVNKNLQEGVGNTKKVYEVIISSKKIAVFGIGLLDPEDGENRFLPIIGESHIAAMPYEIIIQGNKATMLHGRFRFALHWPELTMGTFTKIMSTPGYVKNTMKKLTRIEE